MTQRPDEVEIIVPAGTVYSAFNEEDAVEFVNVSATDLDSACDGSNEPNTVPPPNGDGPEANMVLPAV